MNPWEQDWSGAAPQANDKAPWEQDWGKPSDVTKGGVLDTVRDYTLAGLSKAGQGSMQAIAGIADTVSAPVAKTRAMLTGAAALADRWLPGDINPTLQELAQDDAAAAEAKAQQNALNNPLARGTMALRDAARERGQMLQDFDKEFNPELVRQEGEMSKAQGFWENAKAIKDNPLAFYGNLMQSAPAMAAGIGASSWAARATGALGKVAGMSDEAALALATRSAGAVGTASEAALSGSQAREGIRSNILATPHAQLAENSPRYQELMSQPGMTPALARDTLANEVSTSASLLTSAATALGSTVTNRVFGNLEAQMIAGNKLGAKDALLKMPAKETAEESAQGMGEDYVQHRAMLPADKTNAYDPGGSFVQNAAAGLAMSGPGSVGGYARQQYNASRGLNPDGTKPATPPAAPPADVAMDIRFPDGTVSKDPGQTDSDTLRARYEVARKAAMDAQADPGANPRTIMVLNAESDRLGKEWQNSLKLKGAVSKDPAGGKFDYAAYDQYRTALESGGRADAKNPNSSATGLHQFTERTWLATVEQAKPAWANGLSREQILDARTDPAKSTEMVRVLDKQNATRLASEGQPVNEHTLYAAHHFGAGRAVDFAKAGDDVLMSNILSPSQMRANPYLEGLTKAQAIANWDSRAGGAPATASPAAKPAAESDIASTEADAAAEALQPREAADVDKVAELDKQAQALERRWNDLNTPEYGPTFDTERADLQSQIAALRGEREQLAKDWPKPEYGHPTSFATESGVRLDGRYALVDADALVTSHNSLLNKNGAYPQELQPRERDRAASEAQISGIVNKLDPARLGMSADAATGAPIIGADGVVESGNARTIALMRAYEANGQKAAEYRQFLSDNANQFGLSAEQVGALKNPVLVRVRDTPVDRAEFARQANASTVAAMSPSEQARSDAQRIDNMEDLTPNDDGDFATSRDFIRRFMARLPMTEQAGMVDASGALSTAGYARVRNAVLAKAYGDSPVLQRLTESMDDNLRNISKALVMAAPEVAKMRSAIEAGARFDVDITPDLMAAVTELSRLKDAGTSVQDAIAQVGMFGEYSAEVRDLLQFLADNIRRPRRIADFVRAYYAALDQAGDPNQGSLLGETQPPAKGDLMTAARQDAQGELLDGNPATATRSAADAAGDQGRAQAGPEGRVQRSDEARRGQGDQVDGAARSEAAVAFDFDATEKALGAERDATSESIESEWVNSKTGAEHRRRTDLERAIYDAVTSSSLDAENAGPIVDTAIQGGRLDLAEYAVKRAENYANSMGTTPGVSPSSPKYDGIKQNLERAKAQAIKAAAELRAKLEQAKGRRESPTGQWRAFPPDMGSLGIPRAEMPQIKGEHRGAFIQFLKGRGIEASEQHEVDAAKLKPTQAEFSMAKVEGFLKKGLGSGRSVLVSSDGYVLDGHHQWMAHAVANQDIPVITLNAPMRELLAVAHEFPSVQRSEGAANDPNASRREAVQDFKAAMADLADIATKWQRAAMVPEKDADLMPVLARLFDAAIRIVGTDLKAATRWVKDQLRANPATKKLVNKVEPMSFRKAAEQALEAMSEPPAQGGLFDSPEQASEAVQGDMFGLPEARPYAQLSADEKAAFDRRQGIRASQRESAPRKVTSENYDAARDNYSPPDVSSFMPKEALAAADKVIAEHQSEKRTNAAPTISADDRARAESLLTPVLAKAAEAKAEFDQKVIDIAQRVGALGQQLAPLKGLKRGAEKLVEEKFDVGGMKDLLRSTIVVRSYADAQAVMDAIESEFKLLRAPKNRTGDAPLRAQGKDVAPEDPAKYAGYSDIMVNVVMPNGTIAEIQINTPDMLAAKGAQGHKLYEVLRAEPKGSATFDVVNAASLAFYAEARAAARNSSSVMRDQSAGQNPLAGLSPSQGAFSSSQNRLPSGNSTYDRSMPSPSARSMPKTQPGGNLSGTFMGSSDTPIVPGHGTGRSATGASWQQSQAQNGVQRHNPQNDLFGAQNAHPEGNRPPGTQGAGAAAVPATGAQRQAGDVRQGSVAGVERSGGRRGDGADHQARGAKPAVPGKGRHDERDPGAGGGNRARRDGVPVSREIPAKSGRNYSFSGPDDLTYAGSWAKKAEANVAAVELLKQLIADKRQATPDEQAVLAKFVGWGASELANNLFGDKLNASVRALGEYSAAVKEMDRLGRGWLSKGGQYRGNYADPGYYQATGVLRAAGKIGPHEFPLKVTREQLDAAKPDAGTQRWIALRDRLKAAMTEAEWKEAARTTQYGHYTSKAVVQAMWSAMQRMGFKGGAVLEPGAGIGVFPGLMPADMAANSTYTGIEYDTFTGNVLKQLMPDERIVIDGYQNVTLPKDFYDVAIGNPPFASMSVLNDNEYKRNAFKLHDYFFAKTIDRVKPGGLMAFVTSRYTMDKLDDKARAYLAERADLVGAIRMPQTAFKQNAGTEVVTDVLFLRKKVPGETFEHAQPWAKSTPMKVDGESYPVNEYFHAHPEMVLGTHSSRGSMRAANEYTVLPGEGDIEAAFAKAAATLPANVYRAEIGSAAQAAQVREIDFNPTVKKEGNFYVTDKGVLMQREGGAGLRVEGLKPAEEAIVKAYVPLRDAVKQAQYDQLNGGPWEQSLAALQAAYKTFTDKHGQLLQAKAYTVTTTETDPETGEAVKVKDTRYRHPLESLLRSDPDAYLTLALEKFNDETGQITTTDALNKRVLEAPAHARVETAHDALLTSLNDLGRVDIAVVAKAIGVSEKDAIDSLGTAIYQDPSAGWQMADEYLSGNVKKKLAEARAAAQSDARYERNVAALEAAQPAPKTPADINVGLGMNWVPAPFYEQFLHDLAGTTVKVNFNTATREWSVEKVDGHKTPAAIADWGTGDRDIADLLVHALKGTPIDISRTEIADGSKKTVKDHAATEAANEKLKALRERFEGWVWENPERSDKLVQLYNDKFNTTVPRRFDGRHLTLPGTTSTVTVFDHVKRGAWRIIQSGNTYLAHAVGSGKTWQMVISAMEQKRLGLIKKPMFVVPNHMLQQFASEWMQLYPAARLMVADEENFHTNNRRRFVSRVALSDLDGVIITQSAFKILDLAPEFKAKIIQEQLDQLEASLHDADPSLKPGQKSRDPTVKQIQAKIEKLETRLQAAMSSEGKDKNVMFDELGVDMLYVDEAHGYRKLDYATSRKVKGLSSDGSAMALDMYAKVRYLAEKNPKRNLVMASGTPITNTIAELYSLQRFMAPEGLEERGLTDFDSWAAQYGREVTALEAGADGKYSPVTRFQRFVNVGDLTMAFRQFADVLTADDLAAILGDKRPKVNTGARQLLLTPKTDGYHEYQKVLADRTEASRKWRPSKDEPNNPDPIIAIIGDGRLAAIDTRFVTPGAENDPQSKLNQMIDKLVERYKETAVNTYIDKKTGQPEPLKGGTMMVFSDIGFGDGVRLNRGFDTRAWVNKRLAEAGVDMKQVAYMSDYKASADKLKLFRDVNAGKIRILFGTSKNMGTGVNAQQRLTTIFHLDPTWYPADIEQREGRAVRQGNKNPSVDLYAFATKGTYDQNMWQMIARKAAFIDQIMTGDGSINEVEDVDSESNYSVLAAMVADDPRVLELAGQENEVKRLERLYQAHETQRQSFIDRYRQAEWAVQGAEKSLPAAEAAAKKARDLSGDNFTAKVGKATITERAKFGEALIGQLNELSGRVVTEPTPVGEIGGMPLVFHGSKVGSAFSAWIELQAGEPMNLVSNPGESPAGIAMRAQNAVAAVARRPDKLRERIAEQKAVMESIKDRRQAPFPMAQMLTDARAQVQSLKATLAAEGAAQAEPAANVPTMSRGVAEQDGAGVKLADVQAMADRVAAALPKLPGVEVLQSTQDAPPALLAYLEQQGAMDDAEGAFHDGKLYLFADNLASMERAEHVLATHEAGHAGLAAILGADRARVMQSLLNLNDDLNRRANAVAKRLGVPVTTAVEELLVDVPPADLVKLKGWRRVAHKVQQWLARSGFTALAARMGRWLESRLSDQQKADLLAAELMTAAREHLAGRKPAVRGMTVDAQQQAKWLNKQAAQRGYENADAMALADFDGLESLMAQWRGKNPAAAMLARRIVRGGYRTVNDSVIPETPEYEGNLTGDLAQVPAGKTIKAGPIRLPVGMVLGSHRGYGVEHMGDNARKEPHRAPKAETGELAEDLVRQAVEVLRGVREVHHDGRSVIFPNPLMKLVVVADWREDHYDIATVRPYDNAIRLWGVPERIGRLTFPIRDAAAASPSLTVARESSLHPDRSGLEVASERFDFNTDKPKSAPQVTVKKRRTMQAPAGAGAPLLSRAAANAVSASQQQFRDAEKAYGGKPAYEKAKAAGKTKLTYGQWVQVRTPNFKRWFGDWEGDPESASKVIDAETGEPLVVYHGTGADFTEFDGARVDQNYGVGDERGFFFTSKPGEADWAADHAAEVVDGSASVMPVFLDIKNPTRVEVDPSSEQRGLGDPTSYLDAHKERIMGWAEDDERDGVQVFNPARGYGTYVAFEPTQIKSATGNNGNFDGANSDIRLSRAGVLPSSATQPAQNLTPAQRADALIRKSARTAQPLDVVSRAITRATGVEWATKKLGGIVSGALARYTPESVKAGLVSDYGLDPRVRDERVLMQARQQVQLRKAGEMIDSLASLTREESAAAYRWMNETDPDKIIRGMDELPEGSAEKLQEIQRVIDKLSQEAVDLGQLDQRSYERNKFAYLHRSYAKHVLEPKGAKAARARTVAVLGNQYKGRGTTENVAMAKVRQTAPEWWDVARKAGKADPDLIGRKLTRYDRLAPSGAGTQALPGMSGRPDGRVLETVYLPAERAAPAQYAQWRQGPTFEVRDAKRGDLTLWRDWTAEERQKMGEIDEARFAIAKTLHGMIRDVEVGRFLGWLSRTQAKPTEAQLPAGATIVDASESLLRAFVPGEWVKVPETTIAGTAVKKYGELAGKYVEGPVWNEVRQALHTAQGFGKVYGAILNAWKLSKALALDTPLPTPGGWTTMGDLQVGDTLFDENGKPCTVLGKSEVWDDHDCYRVEFSDGTSIVADAGHLWMTIYQGKPGIRETTDILATLKNDRGDNLHRIPVAGALDIDDAELPVDPYVFGYWLGDGDKNSARLTLGGHDLDEATRLLEARDVKMGEPRKDKRNDAYEVRIYSNGGKWADDSIQSALRSLGVLGNKHIPALYLRASVAQRRALLRGIMDSDGCAAKGGMTCRITTSTPRLGDGILELIRSLGLKPRGVWRETYIGDERKSDSFQITFAAYIEDEVFTLPRKLVNLRNRPATRQRSKARSIVGIVKVDPVPVQCILVSSPSHLFLAGDGMIPTHNTAMSPTVHMNNIMSNFVMADWHDVTAGHVAKALRIIMGAHDSTSVQGIIGLAGKGMKAAAGMADQDAARELVKRYKDSGAELGSFVVNETMKAQVDPLLAAMEAELRADPNSTAAQVGVMSALQLLRQGEVGAAAKAAAGAQGVRQVIREGGNMIDLYQSEDSVFRLASWLKAKEEGKTDIEAGRIARHSFMDYNINAPWVQAARKTVLPFISYTYRAAPMLADIAMNKPHKILKLMAVAGAIDLLGSLLAGGGADDDKVRKLLPKEKAGGVWGMVPKLIRMPWNDDNGSPVFLDIRRWAPMGDVFDLGQGHAALPIPPSLMPGGPLALAGELIANKSQFTGKPIVLETDTAGQKAGKVADFVYKWAAPNVLGLPGSYATTGVIDAAKGRTDAFGRERSVAQAIASSIGVKAASYPRDILERNIILESKGKQAELERGMRQLARQRSTNAISDAEFERAIGVEQGKLRKLREETQERLEAGRTH